MALKDVKVPLESGAHMEHGRGQKGGGDQMAQRECHREWHHHLMQTPASSCHQEQGASSSVVIRLMCLFHWSNATEYNVKKTYWEAF